VVLLWCLLGRFKWEGFCMYILSTPVDGPFGGLPSDHIHLLFREDLIRGCWSFTPYTEHFIRNRHNQLLV
jgi:hypothetical protein